MFGAAKYATASYKDVKGKVNVQDDDLYWMWAAMAHNAGQVVRDSLEGYFRDLEGETPANVYDMVIRLVEKPLLEVVMGQAENNQSRAAEWLGLNRNTLRKKLVDHQLL